MSATLSFYDHNTNSTLFATGDDIKSIWNPYQVFNVRQYGARGNGTTDDTLAIAACIAAAVAHGGPAHIYFPKGTYLVQDPSTSAHASSSDGPIRIPPGAQHIRISGSCSKILLGPNGAGTAVLRNFGRYTRIDWLDIDCNANVALSSKANCAIQSVGSLNPGIDGSDYIIENVNVRNSYETTLSYSTGTVVYDHTGGSSERLVTLTGGSFPAWVDAGARIKVGTDWGTIASRINATNITLSSGPSADVSSGPYEAIAEPNQNGGRDGVQSLSGTKNGRLKNVRCYDMGWNGIRLAGDNHRVQDCYVFDQRGNGLRVNESTSVFVDGFTCYSDRCSARCCILIDPGSGVDTSPADNTDVRCQYFFARKLDLYSNCDGRWEGACIAFKVGACRNTVLRDSVIRVGKLTNNVSFRVEDCCTRVSVQDCEFVGKWMFTSNQFMGIPTTFASNGAGTPKLNITLPSGHGLVAGKSFWVHKGNSNQDNQEHVVNSVATNVITTNTPYQSSAVGSNIWAHAILEELYVARVKITRLANDGEQTFMDNIYAWNINMEDVTLFQEGTWDTNEPTKQYGVRFRLDNDRGLNRLRVVRFTMSFNTSNLTKAFSFSGQDQMKTSGKTISYGHEITQRRGGTTVLVDTYNTADSDANYAPNRALLFNTVGENPRMFYGAAAPTGTDVTFAQGDRVLFTAPTAGNPADAVCTAGGAVGTWKSGAAVAA